MEISAIKPKTGKKMRILGLGIFFSALPALAQSPAVSFSATTDTQQVALGDSLVLTLTVRSEGDAGAGEPSFEAPDFDVGQQSSSISMSSQYDSSTGQMATVTEKSIQVLLHPRKQGKFKISHLQMKSGNQPLKAPDVQVWVGPPGKTQFSSRVSQNAPLRLRSRGMSFRGRDPRGRNERAEGGSKILIKAEVDRQTAYKGQKVIVSYYIYHQPRVFNVQMDQFPVLTGFLREDLDSLAMGQNLESEQVKLNGETFSRSLLARYAAYPVSEGQLIIDPVAVKYNYLEGGSRNALGLSPDQDPFFGFFNQMAPKVGSGQSDPLTVQVAPLPQEGRPEDFSGGVGEFNLVSLVDKYEVRANEAMTLTLKVEGNGNLTSLQAPQGQWPSQVELFDTHGRALPSRGGTGAKVFEFLLIPRKPGELILPSLKFSFFDPDKKVYYTRATEPITIHVLDPLPGSENTVIQSPALPKAASQSTDASVQSSTLKKDGVRGWLPPEKPSLDSMALPVWRYLYGLSVVAMIYFLGWVCWDQIRRKARSSSPVLKDWSRVQSLSPEVIGKAQFQELIQYYETLSDTLLQTIDDLYSTSARSTPRAELQAILRGAPGFSEDLWVRLIRLLDFADLVRFAGSSGAVSEENTRMSLREKISEAQAIIREMRSTRKTPKKRKG